MDSINENQQYFRLNKHGFIMEAKRNDTFYMFITESKQKKAFHEQNPESRKLLRSSYRFQKPGKLIKEESWKAKKQRKVKEKILAMFSKE